MLLTLSLSYLKSYYSQETNRKRNQLWLRGCRLFLLCESVGSMFDNPVLMTFEKGKTPQVSWTLCWISACFNAFSFSKGWRFQSSYKYQQSVTWSDKKRFHSPVPFLKSGTWITWRYISRFYSSQLPLLHFRTKVFLFLCNKGGF